MNCRQAEKALSRHLDGELPEARVEALERHLSECATCRDTAAAWAGYGEAMKAGAPAPRPDPIAAWYDIRRTLRNREESRPAETVPAWWARPLPWVGTAAALALLAVGYLSLRQTDPRPSTGTTVEYVETGLPDASTLVYVDDESGWTIVWVLESSDAPGPMS
ncbi:MAG: zf-HC2 domain-containing protein [Opitutaceae bacterium]